MKKPKYRFTPYITGLTGLKTVYRQEIQTGIDWMIEDFKKTAILRNFSGSIRIYERRYREYDNCLLWKHISTVIIDRGTYQVEDFIQDPEFERNFWQKTTSTPKVETSIVK